jgi:diguanylate cyclase (GGDEF)-like protein
MSIVEHAAARILSPLSALLQKPLSLVDSHSPEARQAFSVRSPIPRVSIVSNDGKPFTEDQRLLLHEIFDVIRTAEENDARFRELESRMLTLQRENLDLVVRNRVLSEVTTRDTLTGLYNRWYVMEKIESEINRALRHGSPVSLLMIDIDHFKNVNDSYGHGVGDMVLQSFGRTLRESCRVYDVPGRYGGEEFCVVLPETRIGHTPVVAERIRARLAATPTVVGDESIVVTASIGAAGLDSPPEDGILSPSALIDRADRALYSAKSRGRNRVEMWENQLFDLPPDTVNH